MSKRWPHALIIILSMLFCYGQAYAHALIEIPYSSIYPYFSFIVGDGRSYDDGYQSVGLFSMHEISPTFHQYIFFDLQPIRIDSGRYGGSYGVGWRTPVCKGENTFGLNMFYDARNYLETLFNQIGWGTEFFSRCYELRCNGYLPIANTNAFQSIYYESYTGGYSAYNIMDQSGMWGIDAEIGARFPEHFVGVGPYFYNTFDLANALVGVMVRGSFLGKYVKVDILFTYDQTFKFKMQGAFILRIPLGKGLRSFCPSMRVQRNPIIVTTQTSHWFINW